MVKNDLTEILTICSSFATYIGWGFKQKYLSTQVDLLANLFFKVLYFLYHSTDWFNSLTVTSGPRPLQLGDNRIVFEDLPTYIGGLYVANLVWPATR